MTPQGSVFNQKKAADFAREDDLIILCGHYEGIDERVLETIVTDYVSIGDYVLTGGEIASVIVMDAVSRLVPGVLGNSESAFTDTFSDGLLEYPQYTRPEEFLGERKFLTCSVQVTMEMLKNGGISRNSLEREKTDRIYMRNILNFILKKT